MRRLCIILALCSSCFAQIHGNLPQIDYGLYQDTVANQITLPEGVTAGELIVTCSINDTGATSTPVTFPVTDGASNSYTNITPLVLPITTDYEDLQMSYAVAGGTVSSLTISGTGLTSAGVLKNISGTSRRRVP